MIDEQPGHVVLNLTADRSEGDGYLAAFPCDDGHRSTSNVNYRTASPASSAVVVDAARGGVCVISLLAADVIVDLFATSS